MSRFMSIMAVMIMFFVPLFSVYSQNTISGTDDPVSETEISVASDESDIALNLGGDFSAGETSSTGTTIWTFVKMVIVLAVVVACIYAVFFFFKKTSNVGVSSDPFLRKVSQISLGPGKSVQIVTLLDNAYIIGVTDNSINLIAQVNDKELVDAMNLYSDKNDKISKPRTFADVLDLFMPRGGESKNVFDNSSFTAADSLRKQRERFNSSDRGE